MAGWLNEEESKVYNYIRGDVRGTVGHLSCPDGGLLTVEVIRTKADIKGAVKQGKPEATINLELEGNIADVECHVDLTKPETIEELETRSEKEIEEMLRRTITKVQQKFKTDIFGFGEAIHRSSPKEWSRIKEDWSRQFAELPVHVKVKVEIRRVGTVTDSFTNRLEE
ncbi:Ger(x)C family spore germination C-terminal domain-containing protein [Paenibacillus hamazuiensis]|uniref:Ger(x)C family spore germination C-terminal domain-containing protein n=1 Tax=Paenibacillus hamazuiensis TaxID=2936508 RepID=UPI00200E80BC|nr:Ger(x)C family spore germination C-terminal domain-containing protein [Paenibacillus hamazuiensis]